MQLQPNLAFNGNAEEVLAHYRDALGGEVEIRRYGETPLAQQMPPECKAKVAYGTLRSPAGTINAMDAPPGRAGEPGDNFILGVQSESREQIDEIFSKLSAGGSVTMPLEKTFWSARFGMLTDKFGIKWMLNLVEAS